MSQCPTEKRQTLLKYLRQKAHAGKTYFKSKDIADSINLSSKEVGCNLQSLTEEEDIDLEIEKWSVTRSTTWKIQIND